MADEREDEPRYVAMTLDAMRGWLCLFRCSPRYAMLVAGVFSGVACFASLSALLGGHWLRAALIYVGVCAIIAIGWGLQRRAETHIQPPPGAYLWALARRIYSEKVYKDLFEQQLVDMRLEHAASLAAGRRRHARWVHVRGVMGFGATVVAHGARLLRTAWRAVSG